MVKRNLGQAADDLTVPVYSGLALKAQDFLNAVGLEGAAYHKGRVQEDGLSYAELGDGLWDERTGGGRAVHTNAGMDEKNRLRRFEMLYACIHPLPSNHQEIVRLVDFETVAEGGKVKIKNLRILNQQVPLTSAEDEARVLGALKTIHTSLRNLAFPEIAKILYDFGIPAMMGQTPVPGEKHEPLNIPGSSYKGHANFVVSASLGAISPKMTLPQDFVAEFLGVGINSIDQRYRLGPKQTQIGAHPENGTLFKQAAKLVTGKKGGSLTANAKPLSEQGEAIPDLLEFSWSAKNYTVANDLMPRANIDHFVLLGDESKDTPHWQHRLGAVNLSIKDLRAGRYASFPDNLARHQQQRLIDQRSFSATLDEHVQMMVVPFSGHNDREYLPGFGGTIGGNCKGVFACWRDDEGRSKRRGVLIDMGITFKKNNGIQTGAHGNWDYVVPDISEYSDDIKDILLTHVHADHMLGIVDLAACGKASDKTVHLSEYAARVLTVSLKKAKVPVAQWPKMNPLVGDGDLYIVAGNRRVMSVHYSVNAIPHSTEVTAFSIINEPYRCDSEGRAVEKKPKPNPHFWSYASLGDMCFGPYNLPDYQGDKPLDTGLKRNFFAKTVESRRRAYPDAPQSMQEKIGQTDVVEIDPTSIHRDGFAPDIVTVQKTWNRLLTNWLPDKDVIAPNLSTAKRFHEMMLRTAVDTQRDISTDGAYLEDRWTDMNKAGVNPDVVLKTSRKNIEAYIKFYAELVAKPPITFMRRTAEKWLDIMRDSSRRTIVLTTGSQGSEIEKDSVGTQLSEGWSRWQLDPKYFNTAYGIDPKKSIVVYGQGVIPGNEETQLAQIRKTAYENDFTVAVPVHNGLRFFNLKQEDRARIIADLEKSGDKYTDDKNGGLFIHRCPLYPPGHGWREDYRQGFLPWFKENKVQSVWVQHYSRYETVRTAYELADEVGIRHPQEPVSNHSVCTMQKGEVFKVIAYLTPSFIFARNNRRADKYHGGTMEYLRAIFRTGGRGMANDALFSINDNGVYFSSYGISDLEQAKREQTLPAARSRRLPDKAMTITPPPVGVNTHAPVKNNGFSSAALASAFWAETKGGLTMSLSKYEQFRELATHYFAAEPQQTFYSARVEFRPTYASVKHLIEAGQLIQIFGDYEATGADKEKDKPKDGAFRAYDLMGRRIAQMYVPMAIAEHDTYSAGASLVGNVWPENFGTGYPPFMAAAMVRDFYTRHSRIDGKAMGLPEISLEGKKGYLYRLDFPDGRIDLEIKEEGKKFRIKGEKDWRKIYGAWHPFNGESYDDFLTSHWFASLGSAHLFVSSRKSHNMVRTDARALMMWLWAFGPQGNNGLLLPPRYHNKTKREVLSTRLGDSVNFHSPDANRGRGIKDGTYFDDGRVMDLSRMHGSPEDTTATAALYFYMRRRFPKEVAIVEKLSDEHAQKKFLQGNQNFGDRPLVGFYYYDQGMLTRRIGMLLATGDKYGQISRNEINLINLSSYDPATLRDKSDGELRSMLVRRDDPLLVPHRTNRTPIFADLKRAYTAGVGNALSLDELDRRRASLCAMQDEMTRIAELAYDIRNPAKPYNVQTPRRLEEDDYMRYGDPEYIPLRDALTGKEIGREPMDIYKRRWKKWKLEHQIDEILNAETQGHATDYTDDAAALSERQKGHKKTHKKLKKETGRWRYPVKVEETPHDLSSSDEARKHDWHLRWKMRDMRFCNTTNCWVMNERGQHLPWEKVLAMPYEIRNSLWPKPHIGEDHTKGAHLRAFFERDEERYPNISTLVAFEADRFYRKYETKEWLDWWEPFFEQRWGQARAWHDAYITFTVQGPPHISPAQHPFMTEARKLEEIIAWKTDAAASDKSDYVRMVLLQPQGQRLLEANEAHARKRLLDYKWTPERLAMMGFDPVTRKPVLQAKISVDPDRAFRLVVPDKMLDDPHWHDQWHNYLVVAYPGNRTYAKLEKSVTQGDPLLLVGQATNRVRMAVHPSIEGLPGGADGVDALKSAASTYATVGKKIGEKPFLLTFQQLAAVHPQRPLNDKSQILTLSSLDWDALVDAKSGSLAGFNTTLTTVIVRDLDINAADEYKRGAVRLRRVQGGEQTGDEFRGMVTNAQRIIVEDLAAFTDEAAHSAGHTSTANLYSAWKRVFSDIGVRDPAQQKLWRIDLKPVDKESYRFDKPEQLPVACYRPSSLNSCQQHTKTEVA